MAKDKVAPAAALGQAMPKPTADDVDEGPSEWETKDHMDTLMKAHEIMNNPVKLKAVHALAGRHQGAIKSIQDIKDTTQRKYGPQKKTGVGALKNSNQDEDPATDTASTF